MSKYAVSKDFGIFARFTPPWNRAAFSLASKVLKPPKHIAGVTVKDFTVPVGESCLPLKLIMPANKGEGESKLPCLVYFHGGGLVFRAAPYHWRNAARYSASARCAVVMPDYRLAFKNPFPAAHDDCLAAYRWTVRHAEELGVDCTRIAFGGDSAGGLLAVDTALSAAKEICPCFLFLVYPVLDRRCATRSMQTYTDTPMWNARLNKKMWELYLGESGGADYVSPAERADISVLPDAYIETAEFDCLKDEGEEFAQRSASSGREVELNRTRSTMHGFDIVDKSPLTAAALAARIAALRNAFYNEQN